MNFFGSKKQAPAPVVEKTLQNMTKEELKEKQKAMSRDLMKEQREIDRQNMKIDMDRKRIEGELMKELKKPKPDTFIKQTYAKQILTCQKNKERNMMNKTKIQSVQYSIDNMFANIKMAQAMGCISTVMKDINKCMNIKEISATMQDLQKEMMKMGIVQEQMDDALGQMNDDVDLGDMEQAADKLILDMETQIAGPNKVLPGANQLNQQQPQEKKQIDDWEQKLAEL